MTTRSRTIAFLDKRRRLYFKQGIHGTDNSESAKLIENTSTRDLTIEMSDINGWQLKVRQVERKLRDIEEISLKLKSRYEESILPSFNNNNRLALENDSIKILKDFEDCKKLLEKIPKIGTGQLGITIRNNIILALSTRYQEIWNNFQKSYSNFKKSTLVNRNPETRTKGHYSPAKCSSGW